MQNYHRHTSASNLFIRADSAASNEDYAKRAVELGHKVICSTEHGWQGKYHECFELAHKYNLKFVFGTEAYWVKDRYEQDSTNCHIIILAKNEKGRRKINDILSTANEDGYYYRPRIDIELLLSLPADDVIITTACVAFWKYEDVEDILLRLYKHFNKNMFLEIQYHNTSKQVELNKRILELHNKYGIQLIVGLDSHYIFPEQAVERDYLLESKDISYEDEEDWYMDYPDDLTTIKRFEEQGVFTFEQIKEAMDKTDILLTFDDYDNERVFTKDIKLPKAYPNKTLAETEKIYSLLISNFFREYTKNIPKKDYDTYFQGVKDEVKTYKDTSMCDYPLIDYRIVKRAKEKGGIVTNTGRGSGVGYLTNTLCGFSNVDRFKSPVKLYPERFISTSRILETHSIPDLDLNVSDPDIFAEAQDEIMTEICGSPGHAYPMIAFGTFKRKSAFKLYARAKNMEFELANKISGQIADYEEAVKNADDEDKDSINIYDYVDVQYKEYLDNSEVYMGIIADRKKAPCSYLLYDGNIREEIGLIKCKSDTSKKEYIVTVTDGMIAENYKFLKNDLLKVDVVLLIDKIFKRIGMENLNVNQLSELVEHDDKVWDLYAKGCTIGINQCEKPGTTKKCMKYKPKNVSELTAFVAAVRPSFKSMYSIFESRQPFTYDIPVLDNLIQTEQFPYSFILYQEQCMQVLNYAGFPMDQCYGIIKAIAKKHPEKVKPLKEKFLDGMKQKLITEGGLQEQNASDTSDNIWEIIDNFCGYGYNASHAYCMALDSLYNAWQKANYPYEFYEVMLQHYSDKGNTDKVLLIKQEMQEHFGISEGKYDFRNDHRKFVLDKDNHVIYPSLLGIKNLSQQVADELFSLKDNQYSSFIDLLVDIDNTSINSRQLNILICLDMFSEFGEINQLLTMTEIFDKYYSKKQIKKVNISEELIEVFRVNKYPETDSMFKPDSMLEAIKLMCEHVDFTKTTIQDKIKYEQEYLGYISLTDPSASKRDYFVTGIETKKTLAYITIYGLRSGKTEQLKIWANQLARYPINVGDVIAISQLDKKNKTQWDGTYKDEAKTKRNYVPVPDEYEYWLVSYSRKGD